MRPEGQNPRASIMRSDALYHIAVGMWYDRSGAELPFGDIRVALDARESKPDRPNLTFAVDTERSPFAVARGEADLSFFNPSEYLTMAYRGIGPFPEPLPLRTIAVFPSWDRMGFAVSRRTGLESLAEIKERRYPLRVSVRALPTDTTRFVVDQVLGTLGFSLHDVESWGGSLHLSGTPGDPSRLAGIEDGGIDAVFDEGINAWARTALAHDMRLLPIDAQVARHMDGLGWRIGPIPSGWDPGLDRDVLAIDFSGWPLYTRADLPDEIAYRVCKSLEANRSLIPFDSPRAVELADLCNDSEAAPLDVPLHPGAERYYREQGALA
jgi:TRAP-type uncharacterized transport system substrate-binding protein